jgi:hypothetical protein
LAHDSVAVSGSATTTTALSPPAQHHLNQSTTSLAAQSLLQPQLHHRRAIFSNLQPQTSVKFPHHCRDTSMPIFDHDELTNTTLYVELDQTCL